MLDTQSLVLYIGSREGTEASRQRKKKGEKIMTSLTLKDLKVGDKVAVYSFEHLGRVGEVAALPGYKDCPTISVKFLHNGAFNGDTMGVLLKDCSKLEADLGYRTDADMKGREERGETIR